ncbi:MAG TPA: TonB-dependent receptor [Allosphingosinicella sp.]|nr:TonB-dependent receptor [Allosphingosinicella sp.]
MAKLHFLLRTAFVAAAAPAMAATAEDPLAAAEGGSGAAVPAEAAAAEDDQSGLATIVVTATRRETDLQRTPISISVMNAEDLADRHVKSLTDLADGSIPGLRVATFEARQSALTIGIRGIVPLDANQPAREQGVGVYIDGVYLGRQHGLGAALLDVERIEVLKGPQGTLFGRNTEGGAVNMVTRAPSGDFGMRTTLGVGNFGGYNADTHINLPAIGNLSFKLDAAIQHQNATVRDPLPGQAGWNAFDRRGLRLAARWRPSEALTADLAFDISRDANTPFYSQLLNYNPLGLPIGPAAGALPAGQIRPLPPIVEVEGTRRMGVADIGVPQQPSVDKAAGASLRLSWRAAPWIELRSISAWRRVEVEQWDNSGGAHRVPAFTANGNFSRYSLAGLWQHQFSQELQAVGSIPQLDYTFGLYYFDEKASDDAATPSTNRWNADGTAYTINDPTPTVRGSRSLDRASTAWSRSYAAYGQATWTPDLLDGIVHLTLGGRYTHDRKRGILSIVNNAPTNFTFAQTTNRFDPMATLAIDPAQGIQVYARYATGYRAGGASSRSLTYRAFGPEEVRSYEIGAKSELFGRRLRLNLAGFRMDRTGSQIDFNLVTPQPNGSTRNTLETINAPGTTRIWGVEIEATARLTEGLTLSAAYAYTHTSVPPTLNPFSNQIQPVFIVFTPRNAVSGAIDYSVPVRGATFRAHLDANYADATQTFDITPVTNDSSFIVNGRLSLADIGVGSGGATLALSLWARNLLNEAHVYRRDPANRATLGDYGNFNAPRTYGIDATIAF